MVGSPPTVRETALGRLELPRLTGRDVLTLQLTLAFFACIRAADYAFAAGEELSVAEFMAPDWAWSTACFTVGAAIFLGIAARAHALVWLGHMGALTIYSSLSVGQGIHSIISTPPAQATGDVTWWAWALICVMLPTLTWAIRIITQPAQERLANGKAAVAASAITGVLIAFVPVAHADGIRGVGPLATISALHLLLAIRMGPRPKYPEDAHDRSSLRRG